MPPGPRSGPSRRFGPIPATQDAAQGLIAKISHAVGGDLPELRVEHFQGYISLVADLPEVIEDRSGLEIAVARQDPVAVPGELARGAPQVAALNPGEVLDRQVGQVL